MSTSTLLGAREAAAYLGIRLPTLYAYVSRGLLDSVPDPGDARRRRYRRTDLERLERRSAAHAGEGAAASGALDWGAPSLETALSRVGPEGHAYRGVAVADLVADGAPFESVAELLWTGSMPTARPRWLDPPPEPVTLAGIVEGSTWPIDVLRAAVTLAGLDDPARFAVSPDVELRVARTLVTRVVASLSRVRGVDPSGARDVAELVCRAFGRTPSEDERAVVDAALVIIADHELNASTFTARVAASTGADAYACVAAALATFTGARHGGACDQCAALVAEVEARGDARRALTERARRGEPVPGFGHRLYPEGDPRFGMLATLRERVSGGPLPDAARALLDTGAEMELGAPTSDMGLVLLTRALELPDEAAVTLFAVGRMAGWLAHAYEQRRQGFMLRPRARYVGA